MKDTGAAGYLPPDRQWLSASIGDIAIVDWGNTTLTKKAYSPEGEFLGVSAAGCDGRMKFAEHKALTPVLSAIGANCGRMFLPTEDFTAIKNTITLTPKEGVCDSVFLYYLLDSVDLPKRGAGQPFISKGDIQKFPIAIPSLDEQKRIVAVLDQAFAALDRARAHVEANLVDVEHLAEVFLDGQINAMAQNFGRVRVDAIAQVKGGKRLPKGDKPGVEKTPYRYITVRDMSSAGTVNEETVGFITESSRNSIKSYTISSSDVYVSIAGTIGKTGVIPECLDGANLTENAAKLVLSDGWLRDFVYWVTRSSDFRAQVAEQTRTAAQPKLALQRLGAISIPSADRKSQSRLVENMVRFQFAIVTLKASYETKLADLANLRQSLLQKAFSGELT